MAKLFQTVPDEVRKSKTILLRLTVKDAATINTSAKARNLSVTEFIRRAALGRKADLRYETEIVLALREYAQTIRDIHAAMVNQGIPPPEAEWRPAIQQAIAAMLRISK